MESLYVEANEPSLENRRIKLSFQYVVKLSAIPSNPAYNCVFHLNYQNLFEARPTYIQPLGLRIKPHLEGSNIDLNEIKQIEILDHPPWELCKPQVCLDLTKHKKAETDQTTYHREYLDLRAKYPDHFCFYTDSR